MENVEHRRKSKRHPVRWKAAVVFDKVDGKPILHTQTQDLSAGGAAVHSSYSDLTGSMVTLLLAQPVRQSGEAPKMLKIRAQVVSSVHSPAMSGFRHGLKFVPSKDDGLGVLTGILATAESARPGAGAVAAPAPPPAGPEETFTPAPGGLLAQLRQAALAKQMEQQKPDPKEQLIPRVSAAVERAHRFLKAFAGQFNLTKPAYAKEYSIAGVPKFDGLKWVDVQADFHTREISPAMKAYEQVTLDYRLSANKMLSVTREIPADEKLKQVLQDIKIEFTSQRERNDRGSFVSTKFIIPCEVKASLRLVGNFETGKLLLKTRNVESFGTLEHVLAPEAITEESLSELSRFILGETRRLGPLLLKDA